MATCETFEEPTLNQLTLSLEDSPVRTYQWPDNAEAWLASGQDFGMNSTAFLQSVALDGLLSKMCPAFYPRLNGAQGQTLPSSFKGWQGSGMAFAGGAWTFNTSESPSDGDACSLSAILETDAPRRYYLSPKAARGILRRAAKRGKELPARLRQALESLATHQGDGEKMT